VTQTPDTVSGDEFDTTDRGPDAPTGEGGAGEGEAAP
jgi:hypothetical protein